MRQWSKTIPCCVIVCTKIVTQTKTGKEDGETDSSLQRERYKKERAKLKPISTYIRTSTFVRLGVSSLVKNLGSLYRNGNSSFRSGEFLGRQNASGFILAMTMIIGFRPLHFCFNLFFRLTFFIYTLFIRIITPIIGIKIPVVTIRSGLVIPPIFRHCLASNCCDFFPVYSCDDRAPSK